MARVVSLLRREKQAAKPKSRSPLSVALVLFATVALVYNAHWMIHNVRSTQTGMWTAAPSSRKKAVRIALCKEDMSAGGLIYRAMIPYVFPPDKYQVTTVQTTNGVVSDKDKVDVLLCLGFFYPQNVTEHRTHVGDRIGRLTRPNTTTTEDVYWPPVVDIVPHEQRPFQFSFQTEAWDAGECRYDILVTVTKPQRNVFTGCPLTFWPHYASSFYRRGNVPLFLQKLKTPLSYPAALEKAKQKTDFCAFAVQYCWRDHYANNDVMVRVIFYDLLSEAGEKKKVKGFSKCRNTEGLNILPEKVTDKMNDVDDIVKVYEPFKFSLVFENNAVPGYMTEKIMNGLLADTIPIYWGAPDVADYDINMDRIVHCRELNDTSLKAFRQFPRPTNMTEAEQLIQKGRKVLKDAMQPCIDRVLELEHNDDKYARTLSQPILKDNRFEGSYFDLERIAENVHSVMRVFNSPLVVD